MFIILMTTSFCSTVSNFFMLLTCVSMMDGYRDFMFSLRKHVYVMRTVIFTTVKYEDFQMKDLIACLK